MAFIVSDVLKVVLIHGFVLLVSGEGGDRGHAVRTRTNGRGGKAAA